MSAPGAETKEERRAGSNKLCPTAAAKLARHQAGQQQRDCFRNACEETEPSQRGAEQCERKPAEKGRDRRVRHVPPSQMTGVIERCQFVAMKAVSPSRDDVDDNCRCGKVGEDREIA